MLCDNCREREATVFVTKIVENETTKQRLCEVCAREKALGEGWLQELVGEDVAQLEGLPLEEIVMNLFNQAAQTPENEHDDYSLSELAALHNQISGESFGEDNLASVDLDSEFPADEDLVDELDEELDEAEDGDDAIQSTLDEMQAELERANEIIGLESDENRSDASQETSRQETSRDESGFGEALFNPFSGPAFSSGRSSEIPAVRCPKCETTWDRLRQNGRVGCANCYEVFSDQLNEVMERLQNSNQHVGKAPRAAAKRRQRLEHLRARRDHRLEMLNARLAKAVAGEDYEEAAKLRDKIKIVESTIVSNEL